MEPASARELLGNGSAPLDNFVGMMGGMGGAAPQPSSPQPSSPLASATAGAPANSAPESAAPSADGMGMSAQPASPLAAGLLQFNERVVPPKVTFPTDGAYVAFVNVRPRGGEQLNLTAPITVGVASIAPAELTPDASATQQLGDLMKIYKIIRQSA